MFLLFIEFYRSFLKKNIYDSFCKKLIKTEAYKYLVIFILIKINLTIKKE